MISTEEQSLLDALDFDADMPCHWAGCFEDATWVGTLDCGHSFSYCDHHTAIWRKEKNSVRCTDDGNSNTFWVSWDKI